MIGYVLALLIGGVAGLRVMTTLAAVSLGCATRETVWRGQPAAFVEGVIAIVGALLIAILAR